MSNDALDPQTDPLLDAILAYGNSFTDKKDRYRFFSLLYNLERVPLPIDQFFDTYISEEIKVWPELLKLLKNKIRPYPLLPRPENTSDRFVNNSGIGTGKSFIGTLALLYDLYFLSCFKDPRLLFQGLSKSTIIYLTIQSVDFRLSRDVLYKPLYNLITDTALSEIIRIDKSKTSFIETDKGIILTPLPSTSKGLYGKAVISCVLDEVNFMDRVARSKKAADGGEYDQAKVLYDTLLSRRNSRFKSNANLLNVGGLYVSSSVMNDGDFLSALSKLPSVESVCLRQWDVNPEKFSGQRVYFGLDQNLGVLTDTKPAYLHESIPIEFKQQAVDDPVLFSRDYLNIASRSLRAFFTSPEKLSRAFATDRETITVTTRHVTSPNSFSIKENAAKGELFIHIDLSKTIDRTGISVASLENLEFRLKNGVWAVEPKIKIDFAGTLNPSKLSEVLYREVINFVQEIAPPKKVGFVDLNAPPTSKLHPINTASYYYTEQEATAIGITKHPYQSNPPHINLITFDQYQSTFAIQELKRLGYNAVYQSLSGSFEVYSKFKTLVMSSLVSLPDDDFLRKELIGLEQIELNSKVKVDHNAKSSKDMVDAVCASTVNAYLYFLNRIDKISKNELRQLKPTLDLTTKKDQETWLEALKNII